ncbi:hypothetical protein ACWPKO_23585 (plasmid) [Coraliomargarita sp. W4R53]
MRLVDDPYGVQLQACEGAVMDPRFTPVVAMDIDGVLRLPQPESDEVRASLFEVAIIMHRDRYPTYLHHGPDWDENDEWSTTHWLSTVGGAWMRDLVERGVQVVWATTWQHAANSYFARPLGLPELPVAVSGSAERSMGPSSWKSLQLSRQFDRRPLLWVDDNPPLSPSLALPALRSRGDRVLTKFHWVRDWGVGITERDVDELNEWLDLARSEGGHAELRRRRRRDRDRNRAFYRRSRWGSEAAYQGWRMIHGRLEIALGVDRALPFVLAEYAFAHRDNLNPAAIDALVAEWGDEGTPSADELIGMIRGELRRR